jgi:NADPH-dependent F420 reductase
MTTREVIAVVGGTGKEGSGLALRWAHAGYPVVIGSRTPDKAAAAAARLNAALAASAPRIVAAASRDAARQAAIVVLAVPFSAQVAAAEEISEELAGKILIDVTVPLIPPAVDRVQLPAGGSAVEALQRRLGTTVKVVSAFQNVSALRLKDLSRPVECDVLVCADDRAAGETVVRLARDAGFTAWSAGPLANSAASEALTSVLLAINRRYKVAASGLRITGVVDTAVVDTGVVDTGGVDAGVVDAGVKDCAAGDTG